MVLLSNPICSVPDASCSMAQKQLVCIKAGTPLQCLFLNYSISADKKALKLKVSTWKLRAISAVKEQCGKSSEALVTSGTGEKKVMKKSGKKQHHLWQKRDAAYSGQKALSLVQIISRLPDEKEAIYGGLDKWLAWETEFPLIAAAKALRILTKRNQWGRVIQLTKWMLSKGQGATMATYDGLLLAYDMEGRVDEAKVLWNIILNAHNRSISKRLFSRMISLHDHHNMPNNVIEVFADMEELGVKPDQDTVRRVARAFKILGQEEKQSLVMKKYQMKWKYIHFKGERVRVRNHLTDENRNSSSSTSEALLSEP